MITIQTKQFFALRTNILKSIGNLTCKALLFVLIVHFLNFRLQIQELLADIHSRRVRRKRKDFIPSLDALPVYFGKPG